MGRPHWETGSACSIGTLIATGQGTGIVVATGTNTEIGRISTLIGQVETLTTPLLEQINHFGKQITWLAIGLAALIFTFAILVRDYPGPEALLIVVALAVGVVPEVLPAVISITLAIGVQRMARRNPVVRRRAPRPRTSASCSLVRRLASIATRASPTSSQTCVAYPVGSSGPAEPIGDFG